MSLRPRIGLRRRMVIAALSATAVALLAVLVLVTPALRTRALARERATLLAQARLVARLVEEPLGGGAGPATLDPRIDEVARDLGARVTIVAPDGQVLADSVASGSDLAEMENHGRRPEVLEALHLGVGSSLRHSGTVDADLMYVAVAVRSGRQTRGVARVSASMAAIEEQVRGLRNGVALSLLLAFLIIAVLSALLASPLTGPLREIMAAARRLAGGDLSARIQVERDDELGELARILNQAAAQLQERVNDLSRDRTRTEAILSAMEEGLLAVDHQGAVLLANDALCRLLDLRAPAGCHYLEVLRQREVGEVLEGVLASGERRTGELEIPHLHRSFALTGLSFPGAQGSPPGALLTFQDVTERRRLDRVRRDFVANASHELRTPLTSIRGFVEALEDGAIHDPVLSGRFLGKIRAQSERMAALADDLLELSRLESEEREPRWSAVEPARVAEEVAASFADLAAERRIELTARDEGAGLVASDPERLRRVLENLVDNALKYTPEGGHVEVVATAGPDGGPRIEVRDDGPGIAAEHLPRLFERFYRVDKARSRELGGTGLGLSIVKHLAEGMGARVTVASQVGRGSCFALHLPARTP